jgi:putative flippase GtrA
MAATTTTLQGALSKVRQHGLKYSAVSVINVIVGQSLLVFFHAGLHWGATTSNVLAVSISAVPAYFLSRAWVWGKRGKNHLVKEVLPFWGFAFAGLVLSSITVTVATQFFDSKLVPNLANMAAFGLLWVIKFFVLDSLMFGKHHHGPTDEFGRPRPV